MIPFDHYAPWQPPDHVDEFQKALILDAYPPGSEIVEVRSYRPGYLDYPYRIQVRLPAGQESACVVKASPLIGGIEREGAVLPVLARLGLPASTNPKSPETFFPFGLSYSTERRHAFQYAIRSTQ